MNSIQTLLPQNASKTEKRLSVLLANLAQVKIPIANTWQVEHSESDLLDYLAWSFSADEWDFNFSDEEKREAIKTAVYLHKIKGTKASIKRVLKNIGFEQSEIIEAQDKIQYNGLKSYNGEIKHNENALHWAEYEVVLERPITQAQANKVINLLQKFAPARCHLTKLTFKEVAHSYNNQIKYDGLFTYGEIENG